MGGLMFEWFKYSEAKLAEEIIAACQQFLPDESYIYDPQTQMVEFGTTAIYLGNLFEVTKGLKRAQRLDYIDKFIHTSLNEDALNYQNAAHLLMPRIKTVAEYHIWRHHLQSDSPQGTMLSHHLTDNFVIVIGLDTDTAIKTLMQSDIDDIGLSHSEALKYATANLYGISDGPFEELEDGIFASRFHDDHDAGRLLLIDEVQQLKLNGDPVAFIPTCNHLFICGANDTQALEKLAAQCYQLSMKNRLLSLYSLILTNGQWQDFQPPIDTDYAPVHNLHMIEVSTQYSEQKNLLDEQHQATASDTFIAPHCVYQQDDSRFYFSACVWKQGARIWLPHTQRVQFCFGNNEQMIGHLSWQDTQNLFGTLMRPLGMSPERYEVTQFPDSDKILAIMQAK